MACFDTFFSIIKEEVNKVETFFCKESTAYLAELRLLLEVGSRLTDSSYAYMVLIWFMVRVKAQLSYYLHTYIIFLQIYVFVSRNTLLSFFLVGRTSTISWKRGRNGL